MKSFIAALIALSIFTLGFVPSASAVLSQGVGVQLVLNGTVGSVALVNWVPVLASNQLAVAGIVASNTSTSDLEVGYCPSSQIAGSEVRQFIIPASSPATNYPFAYGANYRVSVRAINTAATSGNVDLSFFYNPTNN